MWIPKALAATKAGNRAPKPQLLRSWELWGVPFPEPCSLASSCSCSPSMFQPSLRSCNQNMKQGAPVPLEVVTVAATAAGSSTEDLIF